MQSDLDLHCQQKFFVSSSVVKELIIFQTPCYGCPFESSQDNSIEYPWQNLIYKSWYLKLHYSLLYGVNPFPNDKVLDETKFKAFADDKLNNKKIIFLSLIEWKTFWEQEKMLVTSIFSFSHNVFKSLVSKRRQKVSCGNGVNILLNDKLIKHH